MAQAASVYPPLNQRPIKNTVVLFDVDGTLTPARRVSLSLSLPRLTQRKEPRLPEQVNCGRESAALFPYHPS